jgi:hypothetical protein
MNARLFRPLLLSLIVAVAPAAVGCVGEGTATEEVSSDDAVSTGAVSKALGALLRDLRGADVVATGGFGRSLAGKLDDVVRAAGEDKGAQRTALKGLFGVALADDIEPEQFVKSMKRAFDLQYEPVVRGLANKGDAVNNLAHVDSIVADVIENFDDIVRNLRAAKIPEERALDLLLAVAWHDVGKMMDPEFIAKVPEVAKLLKSEAFANALAKVPDAAKENFKNKFILQVLCHEFGSTRALGEQGELAEGAAKRLISFIEDHNDGSGNPAAWWNEQWERLFGVKYGTPKTTVGFVLSALDRARQGSIEMLEEAGKGRRLDGGIIKIANNVKNQGKPLGFAVADAILNNNGRSLAQLRTMAGATNYGELLISKFVFFKKALRRNEVTAKVLQSFVKTANVADDFVEVVDNGKVVRVENLDDFFKRLEDNWDTLYAEASLAN